MKILIYSLTLWFVITMTAAEISAQQKRVRPHQLRNRPERTEAPKIGENAPTFKLKSLDGKNETELASFRGEKPVVLFFGSYT